MVDPTLDGVRTMLKVHASPNVAFIALMIATVSGCCGMLLRVWSGYSQDLSVTAVPIPFYQQAITPLDQYYHNIHVGLGYCSALRIHLLVQPNQCLLGFRTARHTWSILYQLPGILHFRCCSKSLDRCTYPRDADLASLEATAGSTLENSLDFHLSLGKLVS